MSLTALAAAIIAGIVLAAALCWVIVAWSIERSRSHRGRWPR